MEVLIRLEDIWRLIEDVIQELSQQEGSSFVLLLRLIELSLKITVILV